MWMDICLITIFLLAIIDGFRKGFLTTFIHFAGWLVAVFLAVKSYPLVANFISANTGIYSFIHQKISDKLMIHAAAQAGSSDLLSNFKFPDIMEKTLTHSLASAGNAVTDSVSDLVAKTSVNIISVIILFILIKAGLSLIVAGAGKASDLPLLKQLNQLAGLFIGFVKGILLIFILLAILVPVMNIMQNDFLIKSLESAHLTNYCFEHNLLFILIKDYI